MPVAAGAPDRDPRRRRRHRAEHPGRDRIRHERLSHPRAPCLPGQAHPAHRAVRGEEHRHRHRARQPWLRRALGNAAVTAGKSRSFLGARYRRLVKRKPKKKAQTALARNIIEIVWQLIADPDARYHDLGADWHEKRTDPDRRTHELVHQLERLGNTVTLIPNPA